MCAISIMSTLSGIVGGVVGAIRGYSDYGNFWGGVLGFGAGFTSASVGTFTSLALLQYFGLSSIGRFMAFGIGSAVGAFIDTLLYKGTNMAFTADAGCYYLASLFVGGVRGCWVGYPADDMVVNIASNLKSIKPVYDILRQLVKDQGLFATSERLRARILMGAITDSCKYMWTIYRPVLTSTIKELLIGELKEKILTASIVPFATAFTEFLLNTAQEYRRKS
jgi:hypothetical protein